MGSGGVALLLFPLYAGHFCFSPDEKEAGSACAFSNSLMNGEDSLKETGCK